MTKKELSRIQKLVANVKKAGADQVDAYYEWGREAEITARDGAVENLKQATSTGLGLRVFKDNRLGFGYTSDLSDDGLARLAEQVLAIAANTADDKNNGLPPSELIAPVKRLPDVFDPRVEALTNEELAKWAIEIEKASLAGDPRVKKVEDAGAGSYVQRTALVNSEGFSGTSEKTYAWLYSVVVGEQDDQKQSAWWSDFATHLADLDDPESVARQAVNRAARMLGARKIESGEMPIIFEPAMTKSFIRGLLGAINGDMIYKKSSFLLDRLGEQVASELITIVDDGTLDRRTGSCPFDGEGLTTERKLLVGRGVLKQYIYDTYTANKAGAKPTGTASREYSSLPGIGTTNFFLEPGKTPVADMFKGIKKGLLITDMMGRGANTVNGEYSRGANGILIENGELTHPVQEITVGGNMIEMLREIDAVGEDMDWRGATGAPSIRFAKLTVAGK
ncbi:MAG: TldD/PmbA family protein [Candidatus Lernaella stagnicola]|nr:TldD/PmbA family protein [Candidatus Lernaella stagnicola]